MIFFLQKNIMIKSVWFNHCQPCSEQLILNNNATYSTQHNFSSKSFKTDKEKLK